MSAACLPDGSCAAPTEVAYVDGIGGAGNACTVDAPCKKVADALHVARPYVKLVGSIDEPVQISDQNVTILAAPSAKLSRSSAGIILRIDGTSVVRIYDLTISDGLGGTGLGISLPPGNTATLDLHRVTVANNAGGGVSAFGGTINITQSTISGNTGGGLSISGAAFDVANSFIVSNGSAGATFGGIKLDSIAPNAPGAHRIEFSTVAANVGPPGVDLGISCGTVLTPPTLSNNIIFGNVVSAGGKQIDGMNCLATYSDIGPDALTGTGNINADPLFVAQGQNNFHLTSNSPAKDVADPNSTIADDVDGDARPQGSRRDMGADEIK